MLARIASRVCSVAAAQRKAVPLVFSSSRSFLTTTRPLFNVYKELSEFLTEEIQLETETQKFSGKLPPVRGFDIASEGANITLSRAFKDEKIVVKLNVNHSVDADVVASDNDAADDKLDHPPVMVSRPAFTVEIARGGKPTLALHCEFTPAEEDDIAVEDTAAQKAPAKEQVPTADVFEITEAAFLDGSEWKDATYSVSGEVMDGNLYDLLMSLLEERGLGEDFSQDLVKFSTAYEHKQYITFLERLKAHAGGSK